MAKLTQAPRTWHSPARDRANQDAMNKGWTYVGYTVWFDVFEHPLSPYRLYVDAGGDLRFGTHISTSVCISRDPRFRDIEIQGLTPEIDPR